MGILCIIGIHKWDGCECEACGAESNGGHKWSGCVCTRCKNTRHNWILASSKEEYCSSCGGSGSIRQKSKYQGNYGTNGPDYSDLDPDAWETVNCGSCDGTGKSTGNEYECMNCGEIR